MKERGRKRGRAVPAARARTTNSRQRQILIEACISALHIHGPSGTTVERVVAIANMSPGIVRFYFDSKAAMLVASLKYLAAEFDERVIVPVTKLKDAPVAALQLLVDLYLDPDIASARKVTVWYAYWGEASSRQEYYDICGQNDERFAQLVRDLVGRLIETSGSRQLDSAGVALGMIGALEILWQDIAYQTEDAIDRADAKRRCLAYLRSVFPAQFAGDSSADPVRLANWTYRSEVAFDAEREALFRDAWACVGHESMLPLAGDFAALETAAERVLMVRDAQGTLRAFRNNCPARPHRLVSAASGRTAQLRCATHDLVFDLDGSPSTSAGLARPGLARPGLARPELTALTLAVVSGVMLVRTSVPTPGDGASVLDVLGNPKIDEMRLLRFNEASVEADWKGVVEQWFDSAAAIPRYAWTRSRYVALRGDIDAWGQRFIAPNQWLQIRPDGICLSEAVPLGPGRCALRRLELSRPDADQLAQSLAYLGSRAPPMNRRSSLAAAESLQAGRERFDYGGGFAADADSASAFRRMLTERMPLLRLSHAP